MIRTTVAAIVKKVLTPIGETIQPLVEPPILELDEFGPLLHAKATSCGFGRLWNAKPVALLG